MVKKLVRKLSFTMILVISVLVGVFLGTGVAYADICYKNLSVGTTTYNSAHYDDVYGDIYAYTEAQRITMSADRTQVTFVTGSPYMSTTFYNGSSNDPNNIAYGPFYIYDAYGNNSVYYSSFVQQLISGYTYYAPTSWYYGGMSATNRWVYSHMYIWKWDGGGWTSIGPDYTQYTTQ